MRRRLEPGHPAGLHARTRRLLGQDYDWRAREAALNRFDQFVTEIDGLDIHFIHQRSANPDALPLIVTHGWPGSVVEFHKVIEPLTRGLPRRVPSLPGTGSPPSRPDRWSVEKIAEAWATLMARLGYDRYGAQGGDWGSAVTAQMGRNGGGCVAIHINMPLGFPTAESAQNPTPEEAAAMAAIGEHVRWGTGFSEEQATRPQTLGYGLTDSPVGQLAWIVEKFWAWTDCDGHPENVLTRDEMLDNVMLTGPPPRPPRRRGCTGRASRRCRVGPGAGADRCRFVPQGDRAVAP